MKKGMSKIFGGLLMVGLLMTAHAGYGQSRAVNTAPRAAVFSDTSNIVGLDDSGATQTNIKLYGAGQVGQYIWTHNDSEAIADSMGVVRNAIGAWTDITFVGVWTNYNYSVNPSQYTKDISGHIYIHGMIEATSTVTTDSLMFTLPAGYRPSQTLGIPVVAYSVGYGTGYIYIKTDGEVRWTPNATITTQGTGHLLDISNIIFITK